MTGHMLTSPPRRAWLAAAYLLCAAAGASSLFWQSPTVQAAGAWSYVWGVLLIIGGLASAAGVIAGHWLGEYAGVLALVAVWIVYGMAAGWVVVTDHDLSRVPASLALFAIACLMIWRWEVVAVERFAARQVRDRR